MAKAASWALSEEAEIAAPRVFMGPVPDASGRWREQPLGGPAAGGGGY